MNTGTIKWQVPLGLSPYGGFINGVPSLGGPIVTGSGLVFIAAAMDNHIRAFDVESGTELWRADLPAGGQATPMTYVTGGRQYLVIAAGGHAIGLCERRETRRVAIVRFDRKANLNAFNEKLVVELTLAAHSFFDDARLPMLRVRRSWASPYLHGVARTGAA